MRSSSARPALGLVRMFGIKLRLQIKEIC